jgi:t-SNARE complex subunit (syntaxin)
MTLLVTEAGKKGRYKKRSRKKKIISFSISYVSIVFLDSVCLSVIEAGKKKKKSGMERRSKQ